MEALHNIWNWALPVGGITLGALILIALGLFAKGAIKGAVAKVFSKVNVDAAIARQTEAIDSAVNKAVDRVKEVTFLHSIQPLVESELAKVGEAANEQLEKRIEEMRRENASLLAVIESVACYFDDSIVSEEKKEACRAAIASAKSIFADKSVQGEVTVADVETYAKSHTFREGAR